MHVRACWAYLMAFPAALLLLAYALVNGVPFIYPDAFIYLAYGETAWQKAAGAVAGFWPMGVPLEHASLGAEVLAPAGEPLVAISSPAAPGQDGNWSPASSRSVYGVFDPTV